MLMVQFNHAYRGEAVSKIGVICIAPIEHRAIRARPGDLEDFAASRGSLADELGPAYLGGELANKLCFQCLCRSVNHDFSPLV